MTPNIAPSTPRHASVPPPAWGGREQVCSVSETLAHGLVSRLSREVAEVRSRLDTALRNGPATSKRAAAYRAACAAMRAAIPEWMTVLREVTGDPSGKDKNATYEVLHWGFLYAAVGLKDPSDGSLSLVHTIADARRARIRSEPLCRVTRHALMRLFFRLRTGEVHEVLRELNELGLATERFSPVLDAMANESQVLLPSSRGAFVVQRDKTRFHRHVALTWLSDERIADDEPRLAAVHKARAEGGLVVNLRPVFPVVSELQAQRDHGVALDLASAAVLNAMADAAFHDEDALPGDWRFGEAGAGPEPQAEIG